MSSEFDKKNGSSEITDSNGAAERDDKGRFLSGNPGRPRGARHKLGEAFIQALHDDFHAHGVEAIQRVREKKPEAYLAALVKLMPQHVKVDAAESFEKLWTAISDGAFGNVADGVDSEPRPPTTVRH